MYDRVNPAPLSDESFRALLALLASSPAYHASVRRGLADVRAGRVRPWRVVLDEYRLQDLEADRWSDDGGRS